MKSLNRLFIALCWLLISCINAKVTALDEVEFELTVDYFGKYVWRGQNLDDDPVFQPGISASYKGLTFGIWGSMETTSYSDNSGEFTEVDQYLDYSVDVTGIDILDFSIGLIYYDFPGTTYARTTEAYWGLSLDVPLSPSVTFYHDIDEADGLYVSANIGHSIEKIFELSTDVPVAMDIGASVGWGDSSYNEYYWGLDKSKANDLSLSTAFPFEIGGWSITPSVHYVMLVNSDIKDTDMYSKDNNEFFVGIGFSKGF